jgi:SH3-like domain-containing protein
METIMITTRWGTPVQVIGRHPKWEDNGWVMICYQDGSELWIEADELKGSRYPEVIEAALLCPVIEFHAVA